MASNNISESECGTYIINTMTKDQCTCHGQGLGVLKLKFCVAFI